MPIRAHRRLLAGSRRGLPTALPITLLLPALALTAACGGGGGKAEGNGNGDAKKPAGPVASGEVRAVRLTAALLTSSDVPHVQVLPAGTSTQLLGGPQTPDKPECRALADQWSTKPKHTRQVYAGAMVTDTADPDKNAKTISLEVIASYKKGEAGQVLDELTAALRVCHGYRTTRNGTTTQFAVTPATATATATAATGGTLGDQQVAYTIADTARGATGTVLVTVVRVGDTTAAFETVRADHKAAALRPAIVLKQSEKLRAAAEAG